MTTERICAYCRVSLPLPHPGRGRRRQFCGDNCRVKFAYRQKCGTVTNRERLERSLGSPYEKPQLSEAQQGWLAGMIDGEGSILLIKHSKRRSGNETWYFHVDVSIANTNRALIEQLVKVIGKRYTTVQERRAPGPRSKVPFVVMVRRVAVVDILEAIHPYLIAKRQQAEIAMEFCKMQDVLPVRTAPLEAFNAMFMECKALNKRGVA